jgi:hypothetical protein
MRGIDTSRTRREPSGNQASNHARPILRGLREERLRDPRDQARRTRDERIGRGGAGALAEAAACRSDDDSTIVPATGDAATRNIETTMSRVAATAGAKA